MDAGATDPKPRRAATQAVRRLVAKIPHRKKDDEPELDPELVQQARRLLQEAIARSQGGPTQAGNRLDMVPGMKVDKYFGTQLPPVCAELGCYVTDDGKRFYCVNPRCQKHKKRATKHTRHGNPLKARLVYFSCPRCSSRSIEMHLLSNRYVCRVCKYNWEK